MSMTDSEILERVDTAHIDEAARVAAGLLFKDGFARVELTPNDMTVYKIVVTGPVDAIVRPPDDHALTWLVHRNDYIVSLVNCDGRSYFWDGHPVHTGYVQEKWVDRRWTAVVLTEFLNDLSLYLLESP